MGWVQQIASGPPRTFRAVDMVAPLGRIRRPASGVGAFYRSGANGPSGDGRSLPLHQAADERHEAEYEQDRRVEENDPERQAPEEPKNRPQHRKQPTAHAWVQPATPTTFCLALGAAAGAMVVAGEPRPGAGPLVVFPPAVTVAVVF